MVSTLATLNTVTLYIFILDIFANFITSYIELTSGNEITSPKLIAKNYIFSSMFVVDILSTFPLDEWLNPTN